MIGNRLDPGAGLEMYRGIDVRRRRRVPCIYDDLRRGPGESCSAAPGDYEDPAAVLWRNAFLNFADDDER